MEVKYSAKIFRENLKKLRKVNGYTQKSLEKHLNLRDMMVFDFENGRKRIPIEFSLELCGLYDCSLDELYLPDQTVVERKGAPELRVENKKLREKLDRIKELHLSIVDKMLDLHKS